ncbi:hypothetical protein ANANG_G00076210 [Anguilla anguilla]|uniref:Uncharacterized protein n=1 Tax=Anguilla anguilla TaxID=7936 RepID=A0A9D3MP05_ANGAN|nr:hypothetical protein ANANG_G00076210 [Anguilla anguilla]
MVRKKSVDGSLPPRTSSPDHSEHALSTGSDSGHSSASLWTKRGPSRQERAQLKRLLSGIGLDTDPEPPGGMAERKAPAAAAAAEGAGSARGPRPGARERRRPEPGSARRTSWTTRWRRTTCVARTASARSPPPTGPAPTGSATTRAARTRCCPTGSAAPGRGTPRAAGRGRGLRARLRRAQTEGPAPAPRPPPKPQDFGQGSYSTHTWVRQQQMVAAQQYPYLPAEKRGWLPQSGRSRAGAHQGAQQRGGGAEGQERGAAAAAGFPRQGGRAHGARRGHRRVHRPAQSADHGPGPHVRAHSHALKLGQEGREGPRERTRLRLHQRREPHAQYGGRASQHAPVSGSDR